MRLLMWLLKCSGPSSPQGGQELLRKRALVSQSEQRVGGHPAKLFDLALIPHPVEDALEAGEWELHDGVAS